MDISKIQLEDGIYNIKDETAREQINSLLSQISLLNNKRSILISDSYFDWSPDETISIENCYWYKFFKMAGITDYYAYNKGGVGFYQKVDNQNFQSILENHYNDIPNKDTIKYIFVFGGYNDSWENQTSIRNINDAINNFVAYCKQNYPNAQVIIGEIGYDTNRDVEGSRRRNNINSKVIPAYCNTSYNANYSYIYLPNLNYCLHNKLFMSSDGVHPNSVGHTNLANAIFSAFSNGYEQTTTPEEYVTCTPYIENSSVNAVLYVTNKIPMKSIRLNRFSVKFAEGHLAQFTHNSSTAIAKFTNSNLIIPTYGVAFKTTAVFRDNQNHYTVCPITLTFEVDNIFIRIELLTTEADNWQTLNNITYIEIMQEELITTMDIL